MISEFGKRTALDIVSILDLKSNLMSAHLQKQLTPLLLWGLGVGYVISGMYFGWNLGLVAGGTYGMMIATGLVSLMYLCFSFSYAELASAIPKAGGAFDYARQSLGNRWGFLTGLAQIIEFVFAPPAIAMGIGAYLSSIFPSVSPIIFSILVYAFITGINIYGVKAAATLELVVTVIAVPGLIFFFFYTIGSFSLENFQLDAFYKGWEGMFAAIPFAIWFFLGIEGLANVVEEARDARRTIIRGFGSAMFTLLFLCFITFFGSIGVGGWNKIVQTDSPLPLAIELISGKDSWAHQLIVLVGLVGLLASFHGLILASGRATYEMGKVGFAPAFLGKLSAQTSTPANALLVNMLIGILIIFTGKTAQIITVAVFGALFLYILSMLSLIVFRRKKTSTENRFLTPLYPYSTLVALLLALFSMGTMGWYYPMEALLFAGIMGFGYAGFMLWRK